jgi:hypothetical protein
MAPTTSRPCPGSQCGSTCGGEAVQVTREGRDLRIAACSHATDPRVVAYYVPASLAEDLWPHEVTTHAHAEGLAVFG